MHRSIVTVCVGVVCVFMFISFVTYVPRCTYGTAQMQRCTRSRSPIASAQIIADQRGVALISIASIPSHEKQE